MVVAINHAKFIAKAIYKYSSVKFFLILLILYFCGRFLSFIYKYCRRKKEERISRQIEIKRQLAINSIAPSSNRNDYLIEEDDYRRGNSKERYYRKTFVLHLFETFNNCCAKCGDRENGIDIDHFIFSKNEGGCFIMKHKDGYLINNAIPLCQTCNRRKSDESYLSFFSESDLLAILEKSILMTRRINTKPIFDEDGQIIKSKRTA